MMRLLHDHERRPIRLTDERWSHIQSHPEMADRLEGMIHTLTVPEHVVQSRSDVEVRLYYRYLFGTIVGDKYLCVVVKLRSGDAFVLTAYLTDEIKRGHRLWPK